jgi:hypothetical protein
MDDRDYEAVRRHQRDMSITAEDFRRHRGSEGTYDGNRYGSNVPRYGRQGGYGQDFDQGYREERGDDGYARYANSGYYPSDHRFSRGGFARSAYPYQQSFRGSTMENGEGYYGARWDREGNSHRGKGPRGYRRSSERIEDEVNNRLSEDRTLDASDIEVRVEGSEVTLDGCVGNRRDKRQAEDCAESVSGVTHVQTNLRVRDQDSSEA